MADTRTPQQRRYIMQAVGTRDTRPEILVRRLLHGMGYRFRLHRRDLPGTPDIVLPGRKKVVFVHGCYWHAHGCAKGQPPKSRADYWGPKLAANKDRDRRHEKELRALGWGVLTVWQCELKDPVRVSRRLQVFLDGREPRNRSTFTRVPAKMPRTTRASKTTA